MRKISVYLFIIMMIISLTGCSWKSNNSNVNDHVVDNHENSDTIKAIDEDHSNQEIDNKDQKENDDKIVADDNKDAGDKQTDTSDKKDQSESVEVTEDLEIEIGEDQGIGGL